ncbi:MAG: hypothetical protein ACLPKB_33315 [Xanthobacteraceae bacterium]
MKRWQISLVLLLSIVAAVTTVAYGGHTTFSPAAWRHAPDSIFPFWSREGLLHQFAAKTELVGLERARVTALLGPPGKTFELFYPASGPVGSSDIYRLSARNDRSFRIDYGVDGKVTKDFVDTAPCECRGCAELPTTPDRVMPIEVLNKFLADDRKQAARTELTVAALEAALGRPGRHATATVTVGQVWVDFVDAWRIAGENARFFFADGHAPLTSWKSFDDAIVTSYAVVTMRPQCLAP